MDTLGEFQERLSQARARGLLQRRFARWQERHAALARFADVDELIAALRSRRVLDHQARNGALAAICIEARAGDELAALLLLGRFAPGIGTQVRSLEPGGILTPEDLQAEALAGFWDSVITVHPQSRFVVRALVRRARLRAVRALDQARAREAAIKQDVFDLSRHDRAADVDDPARAVARSLVEAARARGVVDEAEATLLLAGPDEIGGTIKRGAIDDGEVSGQYRRAYKRFARWARKAVGRDRWPNEP